MENRSLYTYSIKGLCTGYNTRVHKVKLVQDMNAKLQRGVLTCLIGVNGAGKSTLLRAMAGLQPIISGEIILNDKSLRNYEAKELSRFVSIVLTDEIPEQNLRGYELVAMGRMPYSGYWGGLKRNDIKAIDKAIEMVGMSDFKNRLLSSLSDGEKHKLLIAKALAQDTDVILLDEPVAFLDFPSKIAMLKLLSCVAKKMNKSVLLSIHDIEIALQIAHRLWILNGREFFEGEPKTLAKEGKIDFLFRGEGIEFDRETLQYHLITP